MKKIFFVTTILLFVFSISMPVFAADYLSKSGTYGEWNVSGTWTTAGFPVAGDTATVTGGYIVDIFGIDVAASSVAIGTATADTDDSQLLFDDTSSLTVGGGTGDITSPGLGTGGGPRINLYSGSTTTINGNIKLGAGDIIQWTQFGTGTSTLNFGGSILNAGLGVVEPDSVLNFTNAGGATVNQYSTYSASFATLGINTAGTVAYTGTIQATNVNFGTYGGALSMAAGSGITGSIITGTAGTGNLTLSGASTITGAIGATGAGRIGTISAGAAGTDEFQGAVNATNLNMAAGGGTVKLDVTSDITTTAFGATSDVLQFASGVNLTGNITTTNIATLDTLGATTINGAISGSGGLTKTGIGTLTLGGTNTYTGLTTISAGTLSINTVAALAATAQSLGENANLTILGGGTLEYTGAAGTLGKNITIDTGNGTISNAGSGLLTLSGTLTKTSTTLTLKGGSQGINVTGSIVGAGPSSDLIIDGGTTTLSAANTYTGPTFIINGATLNANVTNALPTASARSALSMDQTGSGSSTLALGASQSIASLIGAGTSSINLNANTLTIGTTSGSTTFAGVISGTGGALIKDGDSTLILSGVNTYSGATTINSGSTLALSGSGSIADSSGVAAAGIFNISGVTTSASIVSLSGAGTVTLGSKTLNITNANDTFSGAVGGTGGITLSGGTETLSGTNTYTGTTTISVGKLSITTGAGLGDIAAGTSVANTATLDLAGTFAVGAEAVTLAGGSTLSSSSGINSISGDIQVTGTSTVSVATSFTLSGAVIGSSGAGFQILDKTGAGTFTLSGGSDNTSLATTVDAGTLVLAKAVIGGGDPDINATARVIVNGGTLRLAGDENRQILDTASVTLNGGTFDQNGKNETIGTLALKGGAISGSGILTIRDAAIDAQSGSSSTILAGTQGLTKTTSGTVTLSGANTYTGLTDAQAGELDLNTTSANAIAGNLAVSGGTLKWLANNQVADTSTITMTSGALSLNGKTETVTAFSNSGGTFTTGAGHLTGTGNTITWSGGTNTVNNGGLVEDAHIVITGGTNTVEGGATGGVLQLNGGGTGLEMTGATLTLNSDATVAGKLLLKGDVITYGSGTASNISNSGALANSGNIDLDGGTRTFTVAEGAAGNDLAISAVITNGGLTKAGAGNLRLNGANTYTGATTVNAGTLTAGILDVAFGVKSAVTVAAGARLNLTIGNQTIGSLAGDGIVKSDGLPATLTVGGDNTSTTFSGIISSEGATIALTKTGTGTLTLSGANTYSGETIISAGTLQAGNSSALGTGAVTNNATLDIGSTQLSGIGVYTQNTTGSKLKVTIDSSTTSGKISSSSAAVVTNAATVDVTIANDVYIPNNTTFTILDTTGSGVSVPGTINSLSTSRISFVGSVSNGDLILTANRTSTGFASLANNPDARAAGTVLDNMTNPSTDMTTVLNTLEGLSDAQVGTALDTMIPEVDAGVLDNSNAALNNFVGASLERSQSVLTAAAENSATGISSGDENKLNGIWAKGYGSYLDQGTRKGIQGFTAWNSGTAIGVDRLFSDVLTLGVSSGYAYGQVHSAANSGKTNINSAQGTIYAGYQDANLPYFIDAAGSFAWNWYQGKRDISVGGINRTANADYDGQQYGVYLDGGYKFNLGKNLELTPLASIQWNHLRLAGYTETEAGSMNLSVNRQSYDMLQSGLGASITSKMKYKWGNFSPEFHAKWLYSFINDAVAVTSAYTGGGGSFASNGVKPAKNGVNLGGKLSFDLRNDISIIGQCDTELRDEFVGVYGSATLRYKF